MFRRTDDLRITEVRPLIPPAILLEEIPISERASNVVANARTGHRRRASTAAIPRLVVVAGPCSIHDPKAALEYADRLQPLAERYADHLIVVMRTYFEKPRTSVGWKGLINDPDLDESFHINKGLRLARQLLLDVNDMGLPTGVGVPRHADPAAHRRPDVVGGDRRAHHREPGAPRAGVRPVDAGRLQERHRRQHQDRGRRGAVGAHRRTGSRRSPSRASSAIFQTTGNDTLPRDPARRHAAPARTTTPRTSRELCQRLAAKQGCARR